MNEDKFISSKRLAPSPRLAVLLLVLGCLMALAAPMPSRASHPALHPTSTFRRKASLHKTPRRSALIRRHLQAHAPRFRAGWRSGANLPPPDRLEGMGGDRAASPPSSFSRARLSISRRSLSPPGCLPHLSRPPPAHPAGACLLHTQNTPRSQNTRLIPRLPGAEECVGAVLGPTGGRGVGRGATRLPGTA